MLNFANDTLSIALPQNFTDKDVMPIVKGPYHCNGKGILFNHDWQWHDGLGSNLCFCHDGFGPPCEILMFAAL